MLNASEEAVFRTRRSPERGGEKGLFQGVEREVFARDCGKVKSLPESVCVCVCVCLGGGVFPGRRERGLCLMLCYHEDDRAGRWRGSHPVFAELSLGRVHQPQM